MTISGTIIRKMALAAPRPIVADNNAFSQPTLSTRINGLLRTAYEHNAPAAHYVGKGMSTTANLNLMFLRFYSAQRHDPTRDYRPRASKSE